MDRQTESALRELETQLMLISRNCTTQEAATVLLSHAVNAQTRVLAQIVDELRKANER